VWAASYERPVTAIFLIPYLVLHLLTFGEMRRKRDFELNPILGKTARNLLLFSILLIVSLICIK